MHTNQVIQDKRIITEEFIDYGIGDIHSHIVNTCIKEIFVDSGIGLKEYQDKILFGFKKGFLFKETPLNLPHLFSSKSLSYKII